MNSDTAVDHLWPLFKPRMRRLTFECVGMGLVGGLEQFVIICSPSLFSIRISNRAHLLSQSLGFSLRVRHSHQVSEGQVIHTMTGCAHLLVHLVTTANAATGRIHNYKHTCMYIALWNMMDFFCFSCNFQFKETWCVFCANDCIKDLLKSD